MRRWRLERNVAWRSVLGALLLAIALVVAVSYAAVERAVQGSTSTAVGACDHGPSGWGSHINPFARRCS